MVIKPIPAPVPEAEPLEKVKRTFFTPKPKPTAPIRKVVVIKHEEPIPPKIIEPVIEPEESVVFPTVESLGLDLKRKKAHNKKHIGFGILEIGIGFALTAFSASNYYNTIMRSFGSGVEFLYIYQIGTIIIVGGMIVVYDGTKRATQS